MVPLLHPWKGALRWFSFPTSNKFTPSFKLGKYASSKRVRIRPKDSVNVPFTRPEDESINQLNNCCSKQQEALITHNHSNYKQCYCIVVKAHRPIYVNGGQGRSKNFAETQQQVSNPKLWSKDQTLNRRSCASLVSTSRRKRRKLLMVDSSDNSIFSSSWAVSSATGGGGAFSRTSMR